MTGDYGFVPGPPLPEAGAGEERVRRFITAPPAAFLFPRPSAGGRAVNVIRKRRASANARSTARAYVSVSPRDVFRLE